MRIFKKDSEEISPLFPKKGREGMRLLDFYSSVILVQTFEAISSKNPIYKNSSVISISQ